MNKQIVRLLAGFINLTLAAQIYAFDEDFYQAEDESVAFARWSNLLYLSPRNLEFSTLPDRNQVRIVTIETKEATGAYGISETYYDVIKETGSHSLTALGAKGRAFERDSSNKIAPVANYELDLLLDSDFEFLQARFMFDYGLMFHTLRNLLVGPAIGLSYSYFGSSTKFTSYEEFGGDIGEKDTLYAIRDQNTGKIYLTTLGPHNLGGYWGFYADFTGLNFLELSGALLLRLFDIPFVANGEINNQLGAAKEISSVGGASQLEIFMVDMRVTLHLKKLRIDFSPPLIFGHRLIKYPSLGLTEEGLYFGLAFFN